MSEQETYNDDYDDADETNDRSLDSVAGQGDPSDEFIVEVDFSYCGTVYSGYEVMTRAEICKFAKRLKMDFDISTPNMPGSWCERFPVSELSDAFSIHSSDPSDIAAMRQVFGESVGQISLFHEVMDAEIEGEEDVGSDGEEYEMPDFIDLEVARRFLAEEKVMLVGATGISDDAAQALSKYQEGSLLLEGLTKISDTAAESLSKFTGDLDLSSLTEISDAAAESFSKLMGDLDLRSLIELSDAAAESLSKHRGDLYLGDKIKLSDSGAKALRKYKGEINWTDPAEWVDSIMENDH